MKRINMNKKRWKKTNGFKMVLMVPLFAGLALTISCQTEFQEKELASNDSQTQAYSEEKKLNDELLPEKDTVFMEVDQVPEPVGGYETFYKYVGENLKYPAEAKRNGVQGKVYVQFVVEKDGSINNVEILKHIGAGTDQAVLDVMKNLPKWNPGKNKGEVVRVKLMMPFTFKLS